MPDLGPWVRGYADRKGLAAPMGAPAPASAARASIARLSLASTPRRPSGQVESPRGDALTCALTKAEMVSTLI